MALVEVLYPFGGAQCGDRIDVPADKVGALRRLKWAREIAGPPPAKPKAALRSKVRAGKDIDADISKETE